MNIQSVILLAAVAAAFVLALIGARKKGGRCAGCRGDCTRCSGR